MNSNNLYLDRPVLERFLVFGESFNEVVARVKLDEGKPTHSTAIFSRDFHVDYSQTSEKSANILHQRSLVLIAQVKVNRIMSTIDGQQLQIRP